jgi:hypothetical protein
MPRLALVAAALAATACSPPGDGAVTGERAKRVAEASLSRAVPRAEIALPGGCADGLVVRIGAQPGADALLIIVSAVSKDGEHRLAAYTPYPTGTAATLRIPAKSCRGVERLSVEAKPVRAGEILPEQPLRIAVDRLTR